MTKNQIIKLPPEQIRKRQLETNWKSNCMASLISSNKKFKNVLEIGCESGLVLNKLADKLNVPNKFGIDITEFITCMFRDDVPDGMFLIGLVESLPFKNKALDLVIFSDILEHVENPSKVLKQVKEETDFVVLKIPLEKSLYHLIKKEKKIPRGHIHFWNENEVLGLLKKAGLAILNYRTELPPDEIRHFEERFKAFRFGMGLNNLLIFLEKAIYNYTPYIYGSIFSSNLYASCSCDD